MTQEYLGEAENQTFLLSMQKTDNDDDDDTTDSLSEGIYLCHIPTAREVVERVVGENALWDRVAKTMAQNGNLINLYFGDGMIIKHVYEDTPGLDAVQHRLRSTGFYCVRHEASNELFIEIDRDLLRKLKKERDEEDPSESRED